MRLSNKSTFSLVCLILLLAFVAVPVWSHPVEDPDNPGSYITGHEADTTAATHPVLEKIELMNGAADGYVNNGESFAIRITLSGAAPTDFALTNIGVPSGWLVADLNGSGLVYTARVTTQLASEVTGEIRIPTADATVMIENPDATAREVTPLVEATIYDPDPVVADTPTAAEMGRRPAIVLDNTLPILGLTAATDGTQPIIKGERSVADLGADQWSGPFTLEFTIADSTAADLDLSTISFKAEPDVFTFASNVSSVGTNRFSVTVTPKANPSTTAETVKTAVTITISVDDKAGNTGMTTATVNLAPRPGATPTPATIPTPALGSTTAGATLTVTFSKDPGTVTATGYSITGTGTTRMIAVPAAQGAGSHSVALTWDNGGSGTVTYTIPAAPVVDPNTSPDITIGAGEFLVVVRSETGVMGTLLKAYDPTIKLGAWSTMPDLQNVFDTGVPLTGPAHGGGALILTQSGDSTATGYVALNPGTVGISEIMWAIDESQLNDAEERQEDQWIELHNLNTTAVTVKLSWKTGAKAIAADTSINGNLDRPYLDVVTNVFHDRPGNAHWVLPGQNGNPIIGKNFVSAARNGTFSLTSVSGNPAKHNQRYTRTDVGNAGHSPDGRNKDQWAPSTVRYANRVESITTNDDRTFNVAYEDHGTPGRANTFSPERAELKDARTNVPMNTVVFNEIANRSDGYKEYEWIELRNVGDSNINLRNYLISIVTGKNDGDDKVFYQFPNANLDLPAGEVILLVDTDPSANPDHPLAVGYNVDLDDEEQVVGTRNNKVRYKVTDFAGDGLPNGNFVLILRRPDSHHGNTSGVHGGQGVAETGNADLDKIVDVAGYLPNNNRANYTNSVSSTNLWPLRSFEALDFNQNKFDQETVHYRRNLVTRGSHNDHRAAFNGVGYTGVGYKRQADDSNAHGGSPGYHANTTGKAADNKVIISEIMLSQGTRGNLPQWIELYNPSKTHAVNLADNAGWRLIIENPDRAPIITINFNSNKHNVKVIPPNQTVLIVSSSARDYGSDTLPRGTVFPNTRVLNAFTAIRGETFELASRTDPLLNPAGFNLVLKDGKTADGKPGGRYIGEVSDEIGSLDGNARTSDEPAWEFPSGMTEDGNRTSLIRLFAAGEAQDGMMAENWTRASDTDGFAQLFVRHTWYGDETDYGTPADRTGSVLPVSLSHFRPTLEDGKVVVRWTTESELDNAGFNILRSDTRNGEFAQVNDTLIQGKGTTGERSTYTWVDATAKPGVAYYYQIEDVSFAGERQTLRTTKLKGYISAENKLTTTWGDLKEVQ